MRTLVRLAIRAAPVGSVAVFWLLGACATPAPIRPPPIPTIPVEEITRLVPPKTPERAGWATDVLRALDAANVPATKSAVCSVLAIVEQESGYKADPAVPGLAKIVRAELDAYAAKLGPLGGPALDQALAGTAPGSKKTFAERLAVVRTEREVDILFRELLDYYKEKYPAAYTAADLVGDLRERNPITTAGSMQVAVSFAVASERGKDSDAVRDELYTRAGGLKYGVRRLFGYDAAYDAPKYRFADFNAGMYASRNAAFQEQLARLTDTKLALDGDVLAYDKEDRPTDAETNTLRALLAFRAAFAPELSERTVKKDARKEKTVDFEATDTWRALKRVYRTRYPDTAPAYARIPEVDIVTPKLSGKRSTNWYATNVDRRYQDCLRR